MSCYHPLIAVHELGDMTSSGKKAYRIIGSADPADVPGRFEHVLVPCGHCIGCRLDYSRTWADRMCLELQSANGMAIFLTLTYNNENLPVSMFNEDMSVAYGTLDKRDCQLFLKRLRKAFPDRKLRFYLAGEYGPLTKRPHYHAIIFGLCMADFGDLIYRSFNELGNAFYTSPFLEKVWNKGFVLLSDVSYKTFAYVSRYVTKKLSGPLKIEYAERNCCPEFSLMSRRPGLGAFYLQEHPECLDNSTIFVSDGESSVSLNLPKYFLDRLVYVPMVNHVERPDKNPLYNPEKYDKICSERRKFASDAMILKLQKTGLSYLDYLEVEEAKRKRKITALKRQEL